MRAVGVRAVRRAAAVLLACYVVLVAAVLLNADPTFAADVIARTGHWLEDHGTPPWMTWGDRVEMILNALMFAPFAALASIAFPRHPWGNWVAYAFLGSGFVEVVQAFVLEPRSAQYVDVVANTLGGVLGAVISLPVTHWLRRSSRSGSPRGSDFSRRMRGLPR